MIAEATRNHPVVANGDEATGAVGDLVQLHSTEAGTAVRLHMRLS